MDMEEKEAWVKMETVVTCNRLDIPILCQCESVVQDNSEALLQGSLRLSEDLNEAVKFFNKAGVFSLV